MKPAVRARLAEMNKTLNGFTYVDVIKEARNKKSVLHKEFVWDKNVAHEIYLKDRARQLIREFYIDLAVPNSDAKIPVREYFALPEPEAAMGAPRRYRPTSELLSREDFRALLLTQALDELTAFKTKYANLVALGPVIDAIEQIERTYRRRDDVPVQPAA